MTLDPAGYILTDDLMRTSLCGVFACGDARSNPLKQIAMAVGEGSLAAVQASRYLDELDCPCRRPSTGARLGRPGQCEPAPEGRRPGPASSAARRRAAASRRRDAPVT